MLEQYRRAALAEVGTAPAGSVAATSLPAGLAVVGQSLRPP
jgi:hypothetical protein